jgi:hypothetical protein
VVQSANGSPGPRRAPIAARETAATTYFEMPLVRAKIPISVFLRDEGCRTSDRRRAGAGRAVRGNVRRRCLSLACGIRPYALPPSRKRAWQPHPHATGLRSPAAVFRQSRSQGLSRFGPTNRRRCPTAAPVRLRLAGKAGCNANRYRASCVTGSFRNSQSSESRLSPQPAVVGCSNGRGSAPPPIPGRTT